MFSFFLFLARSGFRLIVDCYLFFFALIHPTIYFDRVTKEKWFQVYFCVLFFFRSAQNSQFRHRHSIEKRNEKENVSLPIYSVAVDVWVSGIEIKHGFWHTLD